VLEIIISVNISIVSI